MFGSAHHLDEENIFCTKFHQNPITHCEVMELTRFVTDTQMDIGLLRGIDNTQGIYAPQSIGSLSLGSHEEQPNIRRIWLKHTPGTLS